MGSEPGRDCTTTVSPTTDADVAEVRDGLVGADVGRRQGRRHRVRGDLVLGSWGFAVRGIVVEVALDAVLDVLEPLGHVLQVELLHVLVVARVGPLGRVGSVADDAGDASAGFLVAELELGGPRRGEASASESSSESASESVSERSPAGAPAEGRAPNAESSAPAATGGDGEVTLARGEGYLRVGIHVHLARLARLRAVAEDVSARRSRGRRRRRRLIFGVEPPARALFVVGDVDEVQKIPSNAASVGAF